MNVTDVSIQANALPAARRVTAFLFFASSKSEMVNTQSRNFVSLIPLFGAD